MTRAKLSRVKTEHAGAKNGGGYYGTRVEAKAESRVKRRHDDRTAVEEELEEPSAASLREIPPINPEKSIFFGRGADGLRRARAFFALRREHERKGGTVRASSRRTVRLYDAVWDELDRLAEARGISARALMRDVLVRWVLDAQDTAGAKPRRRGRKVA